MYIVHFSAKCSCISKLISFAVPDPFLLAIIKICKEREKEGMAREIRSGGFRGMLFRLSSCVTNFARPRYSSSYVKYIKNNSKICAIELFFQVWKVRSAESKGSAAVEFHHLIFYISSNSGC